MNKIITRSSKSITSSITTTTNTIVPKTKTNKIPKATTTNTIVPTTTTTTTTTTINTIKSEEQQGVWENLNLLNNKLDLRKTLFSGQSFSWREREQEQEYIGVINEYVVILKYKEDSDNDIIQYKFIDSRNNVNSCGSESSRLEILKDYFNLDKDINQLFSVWRNDSFTPTDKQPQLHSLNKQFRETCDKFIGLRLIRQNPLDCLFSFICSQNNNIGRITKMVTSLINVYGDKITDYNGMPFHKFPTLSQLSKVTESQLNELGFGYRSKFIVNSCNQVIEKGGLQWLTELRNKSHDHAQKELSLLMGVGPKVSDCVSLFSLDKFNVVPIDTHVFEISKKHIPSLSKKSLTPKLYKEIRDFWESILGDHSGWAHTILFANEISAFKDKPTKTKATTSKRKSTDNHNDEDSTNDNLNKKKK